MIEFKNVSYVYSESGPFESTALDNVSLKIEDGVFYALIGHTGSGKTTLVQLISGLLKPIAGEILVDGVNIADKKIKMRDIPKKIGVVFQYPEYQFFEETVYKDIAFGPRNMGLGEDEIKKRVLSAVRAVGLSEDILESSPFELSGGQKRRVAIAGTISMEPDVLILDEPTAGLDPGGRDDILNEIKKLHSEKKITVILVSHSMEDVAKTAERVIAVNRGRLAMEAPVREVFSRGEELRKMGLSVPCISRVADRLRKAGVNIRGDIFTVDEAVAEIVSLAGGKTL